MVVCRVERCAGCRVAMKPHTAQRLQHGRYDILTEHCILTGVTRADLDGAELTPRQTRQLLVLMQRQDAARNRRRTNRARRRWLAQFR